MKSRKMVQVNLFAGQEYKCRYRELTWTERGKGKGKVGRAVKVALTHTQTHRHTDTRTLPCVKQIVRCPVMT